MMEQLSAWQEVKNDFSLMEIRLIQSWWETKSVQFIANMLERPYAQVKDKVEAMARRMRVNLYQPPTFERKLKSKEKELEWARRQSVPTKQIKIQEHTGKIAVRIDHKTIIMVKPGTDIEKLKKKYERKF